MQEYDFQYDDQNFFDEDQNFYGQDGAYNQKYDQNQEYCENYIGQTYQILPQSALFQKLKELAIRTQQMTGLNLGWCLLLLNQFKWNFQIITDKYFQAPEQYKKKIGCVPQNCKFQPQDVRTNIIGPCNVCCNQQTLIRNICGHQFCLGCWVQHISQCVKTGTLFMKCMSCNAPLLYQTVISIMNIKSQFQSMENQNQNYKKCPYQKIIDQYQKKLCEIFTTINHSYQCCLGVDCTNCIKCDNLALTTVRCSCGKAFCFKCKSDDHSPCTCQQKNKWVQMVLKQEADAKWMAVNTKLCPWCKKAVQRSAGCNYMACVCGKSFCYMCSKPWQPDHKDHFKCHVYNKKSDQNITRQKQILQRMNFYAQKYLNNQAITVALQKIDTFQKRKFLFQTLNIELTQTQFIDQAYKFAIQCCDCLKWIYAFNYFIIFPSEQRKQTFQFSQGQFQKYKQQLLKKLSFDLKDFLKNLENKIIKQLFINKDSEVQEFKKLKKSIVNFYTSTKSFKQKFILEIENMEVKIGDGSQYKQKLEKRKSAETKKMINKLNKKE